MPRYESPAWVAANKALGAERDYRNAHQQRLDHAQEVGVTVHAALDAAAAHLLAIAPAEYAEAAAWVAAALRCKANAPCTGCPSCQVVTSPNRTEHNAPSQVSTTSPASSRLTGEPDA